MQSETRAPCSREGAGVRLDDASMPARAGRARGRNSSRRGRSPEALRRSTPCRPAAGSAGARTARPAYSILRPLTSATAPSSRRATSVSKVFERARPTTTSSGSFPEAPPRFRRRQGIDTSRARRRELVRLLRTNIAHAVGPRHHRPAVGHGCNFTCELVCIDDAIADWVLRILGILREAISSQIPEARCFVRFYCVSCFPRARLLRRRLPGLAIHSKTAG